MWKLENSLQISAFIVCFLFGGLYCILYDILRAVRKKRQFSDFRVAIQDVVYFLIISLFTFLLFLKYTFGEIRLYIFIAIFIGFFVFRWTLSRFFMKIAVSAVGLIMKCKAAISSRFHRVKKVIFRLLRKYMKIFKKYCEISLKNLKNHLKHSR